MKIAKKIIQSSFQCCKNYLTIWKTKEQYKAMIWSPWPQNTEWAAKYTWTHLFTIFCFSCLFFFSICNKLHHKKSHFFFKQHCHDIWIRNMDCLSILYHILKRITQTIKNTELSMITIITFPLRSINLSNLSLSLSHDLIIHSW